ncbi:MAG TPA: HNH endonuclease [Candidatus Acidoferrales bacterium]|nr:HNH endonuclease [Candidatus Acidoferrales bacterium]
MSAKAGEKPPERVKVYEKIRDGVWAYNGIFSLVDAWHEKTGRRRVYKFKLVLVEALPTAITGPAPELPHNRLIPSEVKLEVWKRDGGKCVLCGSKKNLHFDHDIPYSEGGSSLTAKNIRILCAKHNLQKHAKIM